MSNLEVWIPHPVRNDKGVELVVGRQYSVFRIGGPPSHEASAERGLLRSEYRISNKECRVLKYGGGGGGQVRGKTGNSL
jgi:hypothetical protein